MVFVNDLWRNPENKEIRKALLKGDYSLFSEANEQERKTKEFIERHGKPFWKGIVIPGDKLAENGISPTHLREFSMKYEIPIMEVYIRDGDVYSMRTHYPKGGRNFSYYIDPENRIRILELFGLREKPSYIR